MELKQYQIETLGLLRRFLEETRVSGPATAYESIIREPEQATRLGTYASAYEPLEGLPDIPYVCLRLPTGGGKTVLAAHAVGVARNAWIEKDFPLVLWLVPTNTIRAQTADALANPQHSYRQTLDDFFGGRVRVFDIADFTNIRPQDMQNNCCIVVGTIQTLRVAGTEGRKVYAHNEHMETHFSRLASFPSSLEMLKNDKPKYSFANLLHLHRPLMIVDEAHNAVTGLTRQMQNRVNPCAIIEFTATPKAKSNILHNVTAIELKNEEMIKLPVILSEHDSWQNAVTNVIARRASLAETARKESDYLRPIVLFQAQPKNKEVTANALKKHLIEVERIPEKKIAIATGDQRELDGINLFDPHCPIEFVITVKALKEGWDCSFAYAFCSVSRIRDATEVEQLLGRVLRMPYAQRRKNDELNRAYAFLSEPSFGEAARSLVDKLVKMGFDEDEARNSIEPGKWTSGTMSDLLDLQNPDGSSSQRPSYKFTVTNSPELASTLNSNPDIEIQETADGKAEITIFGSVSPELGKKIIEVLPMQEGTRVADAIQTYQLATQQQFSPAERGASFAVPSLLSKIHGELELPDIDTIMEHHDWSILDHPARFEESEFSIRETARNFAIDVDGKRVTWKHLVSEEDLKLDVDVVDIEGWESKNLVLWLDQQVRQSDIAQGELLRWLTELVHHLTEVRTLRINVLMRCKFILARKIKDRIYAIRRKERNRAFQRQLFGPESKVEVSFDANFEFRNDMYRDQCRYRGHWKPSKHFLGPDRVPAFDGATDGEEMRCAQAIDSLPQIKFWIRNVARHPSSFWLPTARGRFYPDFIARMKDGRTLVIEYKGEHLRGAVDTAEKRAIGELWERRSNGRALFLIAEKVRHGMDARAQILEKIGV